MAAYCFVCDAPVTVERCPGCGREPVVVTEPRRAGQRASLRLDAVPGWVWTLAVVILVAVLVLLLQTTIGVT